MKKKVLMSIAILTLVATCLVMLVSCGKPEEKNIGGGGELPDTGDMPIAEQYLAVDLFNQAYANYLTASDYKRTTYYSNENDKLNFYIKTSRKVNAAADKLFYEEVVLLVGSSMLSQNESKRVYYNGDTAYAAYDKNRPNQGNIPGTGEGDAIFNVVNWLDWSNYADVAYFAGSPVAKNNIKEEFMGYDIKLANMASTHDNKVRVKDGTYYLTLTVDCMSASAAEKHAKALSLMGARYNATNITFLGNTTISVAIKEINGKMMLTTVNIDENINGKIAIYTKDCVLKTKNTFDYTAGAGNMTNGELKNLA